MSRILSIVGLVVVLALACVVYSCFKADQRHGNFHRCQTNRGALDVARYWYALENGMTNPPPLDRVASASLAQNGESLACPGGGTYSVHPSNQHVVCSIPDHMFDTCKGNTFPESASQDWSKEYPLNYRNAGLWWYSIAGTATGTVLRMSGATIVFKGLHDCVSVGGTMQVFGGGVSQGSSSGGGWEFRTSYSSGTHTMSFANHTLRLTDHGKTLDLDGVTFDLSQSRPRIIVETNGVPHLAETREPLKESP